MTMPLQYSFFQRASTDRHPLWRDLEILEDPASTPRQKVAARLTKIEKSILQGCLDAVTTCAPCLGGRSRGVSYLVCMLHRHQIGSAAG